MKTKTNLNIKASDSFPPRTDPRQQQQREKNGEKSYTESNKSNKYSNNSNTRKTPTTIRNETKKKTCLKRKFPQSLTITNVYISCYAHFPFKCSVFFIKSRQNALLLWSFALFSSRYERRNLCPCRHRFIFCISPSLSVRFFLDSCVFKQMYTERAYFEQIIRFLFCDTIYTVFSFVLFLSHAHLCTAVPTQFLFFSLSFIEHFKDCISSQNRYRKEWFVVRIFTSLTRIRFRGNNWKKRSIIVNRHKKACTRTRTLTHHLNEK